nr:hypothetical protein [uncultured Oribacterium sp.]
MRKEEFIRELVLELKHNVSEQVILEQQRFYEEYILTEVRGGKTEEEVIASLSEPRLLAKSIIDAAEAGGDHVARSTPFRYEESEINYASDEEDLQYKGAEEDSRQSQSFREKTDYTQYADEDTRQDRQSAYENVGGPRIIPVSPLGCVISLVIFFLIIAGIIAVFAGIIATLAPILLPVLAVAVILWILAYLFR